MSGARSLLAFSLMAAVICGGTLRAQDLSGSDQAKKRGQQELRDAVRSGDATAVARLLHDGIDPDATQAREIRIYESGEEVPDGSPLQWAAQSGRTDIMRMLSQAGADLGGRGLDTIEFPWPDPSDERGWNELQWLHKPSRYERPAGPNRFAVGSPLAAASLMGHLEAVRELVEESGISPDEREFARRGEGWGWTPLMYSAIGGRADVAAYLVSRGANLSTEEPEYGYQALHFAARSGEVDVVRTLLADGAKVDARDLLEQTPLHLAATNRDPGCCRVLLSAGANLSARTRTGWTPLHLASANGRTPVCEALLDAGAAVDARSEAGCTPLHLAAAKGRHDACLALISRGADPQAKTAAGLTPLHFAAAAGDVNTLLLILQAGGDVNARDALGYAPLHYAAWMDREKVAALLLLKGARVNAEGDEGYTPLHLALLEDSRDTVPLLLTMGADPNAPDHDGWTPLHVASAYAISSWESLGSWTFEPDPVKRAAAETAQKAEVRRLPVYRLLEFGARPDVRTRSGQTPLHVAAGVVTFVHMDGGDASLQCEALLEHGAEVNPLDDGGRTPLDVSIEQGSSKVEKTLRAAGGRHGTSRSPQVLNRVLMAAVKAGDPVQVREALDLGAGANPAGEEEEPALVAAADVCQGTRQFSFEEGEATRAAVAGVGTDGRAGSARLEIVGLLLDRGADPNRTSGWGQSALGAALECGDLSVVQALLKGGADPNKATRLGKKPLVLASEFEAKTAIPLVDALVAGGARLGDRDPSGRTVAQLARAHRHSALAEYLDGLGGPEGSPPPPAQDPHQAATEQMFEAISKGDLEGTKRAVAQGADLRGRDGEDQSAVYIAVRNKDLHMVELLADLGADPSGPGRYGQTPFALAVERSEELMEWLATHGGLPKREGGAPPDLGMIQAWLPPERINKLAHLGLRVDAPPGEPSLLSMVAVYPEQVQSLLALGADPNARGRHGWTALHSAANGFESTYSQESVDMLISAGADVNASDDEGRTPIFEAIIYRRMGMIDSLARAGADLNHADHQGMTPAGLAMSRYDLESLARIRRWVVLTKLGGSL